MRVAAARVRRPPIFSNFAPELRPLDLVIVISELDDSAYKLVSATDVFQPADRVELERILALEFQFERRQKFKLEMCGFKQRELVYRRRFAAASGKSRQARL